MEGNENSFNINLTLINFDNLSEIKPEPVLSNQITSINNDYNTDNN